MSPTSPIDSEDPASSGCMPRRARLLGVSSANPWCRFTNSSRDCGHSEHPCHSIDSTTDRWEGGQRSGISAGLVRQCTHSRSDAPPNPPRRAPIKGTGPAAGLALAAASRPPQPSRIRVTSARAVSHPGPPPGTRRPRAAGPASGAANG